MFDAAITPQMVCAFRIFWNRFYKNLEGEFPLPDTMTVPYRPDPHAPKSSVDTQSKSSPANEYHHGRPPGKTPFEFYLPCLIGEPCTCQQWWFEARDVLDWYIRICNRAKDADVDDYIEYQKGVLEREFVLFDLFRTKFNFGEHVGVDLSAIGHAIPFVWRPKDPKDNTEEREGPYQAALNGFALDLGLLMVSTPMFELKEEFSPLKYLLPEVPMDVVKALLEFEMLKTEFEECKEGGASSGDRALTVLEDEC
jgi:hypothetical protein